MWPLIVAPLIALLLVTPAYILIGKDIGYMAENKVRIPSFPIALLLVLSLFLINVQGAVLLFNNFTSFKIDEATHYNPFDFSVSTNVVLNFIFLETLLLITLFLVIPIVSVKRFQHRELLKNIQSAKCSPKVKLKEHDFEWIKDALIDQIKYQKWKSLNSSNIFYICFNGLTFKIESSYGAYFDKIALSRYRLSEIKKSILSNCIDFFLFDRFKAFHYESNEIDIERIESISIVFKTGELPADLFYILERESIFHPINDDERLLLEMLL